MLSITDRMATIQRVGPTPNCGMLSIRKTDADQSTGITKIMNAGSCCRVHHEETESPETEELFSREWKPMWGSRWDMMKLWIDDAFDKQWRVLMFMTTIGSLGTSTNINANQNGNDVVAWRQLRTSCTNQSLTDEPYLPSKHPCKS